MGPHLFPEDQITDRSQRFVALNWSEKKSSGKWETSCLMRLQSKSNPSPTTSEVYSTSALSFWSSAMARKRCWSESPVIDLNPLAPRRENMEKTFDTKVMLRLWVKVRSGWSDDARALKTLGLDVPDAR